MHAEAPWDRGVLRSITGGNEGGEQAAGAGRLASPLPVPCETAGNGVIAYSSRGVRDGSVNQYFTMADPAKPLFHCRRS